MSEQKMIEMSSAELSEVFGGNLLIRVARLMTSGGSDTAMKGLPDINAVNDYPGNA